MPRKSKQDRNIVPIPIKVSPRLKELMDKAIEMGLYRSYGDLIREALKNHFILLVSLYKDHLIMDEIYEKALAKVGGIKYPEFFEEVEKDERYLTIVDMTSPFLHTFLRLLEAKEISSPEEIRNFIEDLIDKLDIKEESLLKLKRKR